MNNPAAFYFISKYEFQNPEIYKFKLNILY